MTKEKLLETIEELDRNETAYLEVLKEPWLVANKLPDWFSLTNQSALFSELVARFHL